MICAVPVCPLLVMRTSESVVTSMLSVIRIGLSLATTVLVNVFPQVLVEGYLNTSFKLSLSVSTLVVIAVSFRALTTNGL